ncbi:MAG: 50S ribosome-binding GTPase [Thermaerobacter sp.]|nr:50S ribosome-binding GTPase [Thermaerobacter sp.]
MDKTRGWYPGHMVATQKTIRELAPYLTAFVEVVDARAPEATRHRPLDGWIGRTPKVVVLNKADLADPRVTQAWLGWYRAQGMVAVALNAEANGADGVLRKRLSAQFASPFRLAVVGLPNLGKSTLLNRMVGTRRVATGARPGITRGPQWIRLPGGWEWLDLPGVVTPAKSRDARFKILGVVPYQADESEDLAAIAWAFLHPQGPDVASGEEWLDYGRLRGFLSTGGAIDRQRTAEAILAGFRKGTFGRLSLERPGTAHDEKP